MNFGSSLRQLLWEVDLSKKLTGNAELDLVLNALHKDFGKEIASVGPKYDQALPITTGSAQLDYELAIGGIPRGRVTEIFGPESSGKTSLSLKIMANYEEQYPEDERPLVILDMERSITPDLLKGVGLNPDKIIFIYPDTAEECLETAVRLNASGSVSRILIDSVDALQSANYLKKTIGDADMQGIAKLMGQALRQIAKTSIDKQVTNIFINQIRDSMNMYGPKSTTPGGKALKFYASCRLQTMTQKESPNMPNAFLMRVKVVKNKCGPPQTKEVSFDFIYGKGPDPYFDLKELGKRIGILRFAGSAVFFTESPTAEEEKVASGGQVALIQLMKDDRTWYDRIRTACMPSRDEPETTETNKKATEETEVVAES